MQIGLFGASGFIGSHVAEQVELAGHGLLCIVRSTSACQRLQAQGLTAVVVDFNDQAALAACILGASVVINCVAETHQHLSDARRRPLEVDLTTRLYCAAADAEAAAFIQLSTVMVYGFGRPSSAIDEYAPCRPRYSYNRIALEREQALESEFLRRQLPLLLLRPANTTGRRDSSFMPNFMRLHTLRLFPVIDDGHWQFSCIDTRDIGRAMVHLAERKAPVEPAVERLLVKGYDISWLDLQQALDNRRQRRSHLLRLPKRLMMPLAGLLEKLLPYGMDPGLTRFSVELMSNDTLFDDSAIRACGFRPFYTLVDSIEDFLTN